MSDSTSDRLSRAARAEQSPLDDAARARIRARVKSEGPRIVARARVVQRVTTAAMVVAPALIGVVAYSAWPRHERACNGFGPGLAQIEKRDDGRQVLELARARFVASTDAELKIATLTTCEATVELTRGRLYVHARDLGGGALTVSTPKGDAVVHGTVFSVDVTSAELEVDVAEGVVEVRPRQAEPARVIEGQRWTSGRVEAMRPTAQGQMLALKASDRWVDGVAPAAAQAPAVEVEPVLPILDRAAEPVASEAKRRVSKTRSADRRSASREPSEPVDPGAPIADATDAPSEPTEPEPPVVSDRAAVPWRRGGDPIGPGVVIETAEDLVKRGDALARAGDDDGARAAYRRAGGYSGATAEAAWLALARMELQLGRGEAARQALLDRKSRFGKGQLDIEAAWIMVRAQAEVGDTEAATKEARRIVDTWPSSAQAAAAKKWLAQQAAP